jgi:cyclohexa-1,5-dienecarbonyl-CoA hydratase
MVRVDTQQEGARLRLVIDRPRANILSLAVIRDLRAAIASAAEWPHVRLVTIEGAGDHFSYGASVEEHRANSVAEMLHELHGLIRDLLACPAPTAAIVRGRCLGGGFEVALACDLIFAANDAELGVPEIALGVFPPAAAALLPVRVGASRAASAVLTGQTASAEFWKDAGLIEATAAAGDLAEIVTRWFDTRLAPRSAAALRCAAAACRLTITRQLEATLPQLERLYMESLMRTHDAREGIEAFLGKREPQWQHA